MVNMTIVLDSGEITCITADANVNVTVINGDDASQERHITVEASKEE